HTPFDDLPGVVTVNVNQVNYTNIEIVMDTRDRDKRRAIYEKQLEVHEQCPGASFSFSMKFIDPIKKTVKNVFIFLHRKLSEAKDYILDKLTVLGDYAEDKLAVRLNE
ncbi:hypothetical protein LCGC14_3113350, partial [marine sediment metagenome]